MMPDDIKLRHELRPDLQVIAEMIERKSKVLDIGCGDGELLSWLTRHRMVDGRGIEISQSGVSLCVASGLSVIQGDADTDLSDYPDKAFDYVVLSQTLQAMRDPKKVLNELVRISRYAIVSVPNFGYWKNRLYLLLKGRMPVTSSLSYQWYETPNIHFCTIDDFVILCEELGLTIRQRLSINSEGSVSTFRTRSWAANLFGEVGVFMLEKR